jgi:hypothetical protein
MAEGIMSTLSSKYHDEQGRPIAPPSAAAQPEPIEPWRQKMRDRAQAKREARALGPLASSPAAIQNQREQLAQQEAQIVQDRQRTAANLARGIEPPPDRSAELERKARRGAAARAGAATRAAQKQQQPEPPHPPEIAAPSKPEEEEPSAPSAKALIAKALEFKAEAQLYRIAHIERAPHHPRDWSPAQRARIATALLSLISKIDRKNKGA